MIKKLRERIIALSKEDEAKREEAVDLTDKNYYLGRESAFIKVLILMCEIHREDIKAGMNP